MKKIYYISSLMLLAAIVIVPTISHAEDAQGSDNDNASTTVEVHATTTRPGLRGPNVMRTQINANIKNNQDARNNRLEDLHRNQNATNTRPMNQGEGKERMDQEHASSSERMQNAKNMRKEAFEMQKKHVITELNRALNNLTQIRDRIAARITKAEKEGRTMTDAKAKLVIADAKIVSAKTAIANLSNISIQASTTASTTSTSTDTTVDLSKPRQILKAAQDSLKDAKKALSDVVVAIAHAMGLKIGIDAQITATSTTPVATSTTSVTSTTTASTTP